MLNDWIQAGPPLTPGLRPSFSSKSEEECKQGGKELYRDRETGTQMQMAPPFYWKQEASKPVILNLPRATTL